MWTSHKENKYTQTAIDNSNNLEQEGTEVKNAITFSLNSDEMHIEQNSADPKMKKAKPMDVEGICIQNTLQENYLKM